MLRLLESWFADDHALDDRRRLAGYSLARRHGTGTLFLLRDRVWRRPVACQSVDLDPRVGLGLVGLGWGNQTVAESWKPIC